MNVDLHSRIKRRIRTIVSNDTTYDGLQRDLLRSADLAIQNEEYDEFLASASRLFETKNIDWHTAERLVRMALPKIECEPIAVFLCLFLANARDEDPIAGKILRAFKQSDRRVLMNVIDLLEDNFRDPRKNLNYNIDENTLVFVGSEFGAKLKFEDIKRLHDRGAHIAFTQAKPFNNYRQQYGEEDCSDSVHLIEKISMAHDRKIFKIARQMADFLLAEYMRHTKDKNTLRFLNSIAPALHIKFQDLLSPYVREEILLVELINKLGSDRVLFLTSPLQAKALSLNPVIKRMKLSLMDVEGVADFEINKRTVLSQVNKQVAQQQPRDFQTYKPRVAPDNVDYTLLVANLTDRQTWGNISPLIQRLVERQSIYLFPAPSSLEFVKKKSPNFKASPLPEIFAGDRVYIPKLNTKKKHVSEISNLTLKQTLESSVEKLGGTKPNWSIFGSRKIPKDAEFRGVYAILEASNQIELSLGHASHIYAGWKPVVQNAKNVLVCPGRHLESTVIACLARELNITSYELQNGTISNSGRFVKPITTYTFVNDEYSLSVYNELGLSANETIVVGSPRIDDGLESIRPITPLEAKRMLFRDNAPRSLCVFATQPLGRNVSARLARMVINAVKATPEMSLIIRPHPSEPPEAISWYNDEIIQAGLDPNRYSFSNGELLELQAADIVCTYYSTIGIEALALNKPVVIVAPDMAPLPFDLSVLGAHGPCINEESVVEQFTQALVQTKDDLKEVPVFAQGRAIETILAHLTSDSVEL